MDYRSNYYIKKCRIPIMDFIRHRSNIFNDNSIRSIDSVILFLLLKLLHLLISHSTRKIIYLIILQKIFVLISGESIDPFSFDESKPLIWNEKELSFIPTGTIIYASTINIFFSENLNVVCANKTYWGPKHRFSVGPFTTILETDLSDSELIEDHTLCHKILNQPNPLILYDAESVSSQLTE